MFLKVTAQKFKLIRLRVSSMYFFISKNIACQNASIYKKCEMVMISRRNRLTNSHFEMLLLRANNI